MKKATALELSLKLRNQEITSKSLVTDCYQKIEKNNPKINAFISLFKDNAMEKAEQVDTLYAKGDPLPALAGIPIGIKDNINLEGEKTTCASKILKNYISPYNATVIEKINNNMLIPLGKLNMDEFAMGSSNEYSCFGPVHNPWDLERVPGGSSGGSAAAVAAKMVPLTIGSDTGGSIRQPAAFTGVVGMKPTYGRVSRFGLVAFASSLDQIGPFAKTVEDCAALLNVISGHDPKDSTSENKPAPDFSKNLDQDIKGLKIGVPETLLGDLISPKIKEAVIAALDKLKELGATWETFQFGHFEEALSAYYILAPAEASANLARYDGVRYGLRDKKAGYLREMYKKTRGHGFGDEVKRRIILGTFALSSGYYDAFYLKAQKVRILIIEQYNKAFKKYDLIATPTTPTTAFKIGEIVNDPIEMYMTDIATIPVNLAGLPGLSIPCGFDNNLPIGLQLIGQAFDEETILKTAFKYQEVTDWDTKLPGDLN